MFFFSFTFEGLLSENDDLDFEIIPIEAVRDYILGGMGAGVRWRSPLLGERIADRNDFKIRQKRRDPFSTQVPCC